MRDWLRWRRARKRDALAGSFADPEPGAFARRIRDLAFASDTESATDFEAVVRVREFLALNVVFLWSLRDLGVRPIFRAYYALAFSATGENDVASAGTDDLRARAAARFAEEPRPLGDPDLHTFFEQVVDLLARAFGTAERPTAAGFDEAGYLAANPDVRIAVCEGGSPSGRAHFRQHGQSEGRWQRRPHGGSEAPAKLVHPIDLRRAEISHTPIGTLSNASVVPLDTLFGTPRDEPVQVAMLAAAQSHDAGASFRIELSGDRELPEFQALASQTVWTSPAPYVAALRDADVDVANGIAFFGERQAWGDSFFSTVLTHGGTQRSRDIFLLDGRFARIDMTAERAADPITRPTLLCCSWASAANHGHWLMNTLFSVYLLRENVARGDVSLLCPPLSPAQIEHLSAVGTPRTAIVQQASRYVRADHLLYPSPLTSSANMCPHSLTLAFAAHLKGRLTPNHPIAAPERIYLSRLGFPSARTMANEAEVERRLAEDCGLSIVRPHELSLADQIHVMSRAKLVVGQFGAALWNTIFAPPGATVIEIATSNYVSNEYLRLSHLASHSFIRLMTAGQGRAYDGSKFAFDCPIEDVVSTIKAL